MPNSNTDPIEALQHRFAEGRLHHAVLILGQSVEQNQDAALALAQCLLSLEKSRFDHPDLFDLRPTGKARIITVEKTRELIATLNRTSNQGGSKVAIIHEADRMRKESANAFLKTLEEPPAGTYLLLLSTKPYSLLATIRSRCLMARLPAVAPILGNEQWEAWKSRYQQWIMALLDRESLRKDRVSPLFASYGLVTSLLGLIKEEADTLAKKAKDEAPNMDDKEKDALDAGVRRGVRSRILKQLAEATRSFVVQHENRHILPQLGIKLSRVLACLEKNVRLMEVNLKDENALEDFYLSSLRIWTSK